MDTSGWFAYVKYKDNEKEKVPISKISDVNDKGQKIPFQPKDLNDYVYGKLYSVRTSLRSKDGKESKYYAVIGKLAESLEAINAVRPRWPDLQIDDEEPESTGVEDQEENINYCIQKNKDQVKIKKNKKRKASNKELELFIENNVLNEKVFDKNITIEAAKKKTKNDKTYDEDNIQVENKKHKFIYRNSTETKYLQEKILQLENELKEKDEALSFINNPQVKYLEKFFEKKMMELEERLKKNLEKKVIDVFEESVITKLDQKISSIEDIMKTHLSSFTPTSSSVASEDTSESEEKVHLGEGIMCSKYAHQILSTVKEHSDWAVALLIGVYGDNARNMRYGKPRSSNLQSFSRYFVNVAKYHYRKWLESLTIGNTEDRKYSSAQIEDLINSLPTYLSKRCIDMNGPRLKKSGTPSEQSLQLDSNRKKRSYQRRGSLLQSVQQPVITQQPVINQQPVITQQPEITQQLQFNHQESSVQQLQNQQKYFEHTALSEPSCSSWQTPYDIYEPQGPTAVPITSNYSMSENCEIRNNTLRF